MDEYVYELCLYDSKDCLEVFPGYLGPPETVGLFSKDYLTTAMQVVESNVTDLYEGFFDFVTIDKMPLNTLYSRQNIEERYIYQYEPDNRYRLIAVLKGKNIVYPTTKSIVKQALEGKIEMAITLSETSFYITKDNPDGSKETVRKIQGSKRDAEAEFLKVIEDQQKDYQRGTLKAWRVIRLFDENDNQIAQES